MDPHEPQPFDEATDASPGAPLEGLGADEALEITRLNARLMSEIRRLEERLNAKSQMLHRAIDYLEESRAEVRHLKERLVERKHDELARAVSA